MLTPRRFIPAAALICALAAAPVMAAPADSIVTNIDRMVTLGDKAPSLGRTVADGIEANQAEVAKLLIPRLAQKDVPEQNLAAYVWALGLTKEQTAVKSLVELYGRSSSEMVQGNCLQALVEIGGPEAEGFVFSILKKTTDPGMRFSLMNLLAQTKNEALLPETEELLRLNPDQYSWQLVFVYGKMGDAAVPFLLQHIKHPDVTVRVNAINILGQWLIAQEAAGPLLDQYWKEENDDLRGLLLSSVERIIGDIERLQTVFREIAAKEKNPQLQAFAQETLHNLPALKKELDTQGLLKKPSAFDDVYRPLFKSAGTEGSFDSLALSSTYTDEPKLKALRERILQRGSDEAFEDYLTVNDIIMRNRLARKHI